MFANGRPFRAAIRTRRPGALSACPRWRRCRARRDGQVLVIVLLGAMLLVGMLFYTYNAGTQINQRADMQNVADSTAVSGGAWLARSFNVIAMNNVAQSRMVALVPVLDAIPQASNMAFSELNDLIGDDAYPESAQAPGDGLDGISDDLRGGVPGLDARTRDRIQEGIDALKERMANQREILAPFRSPSEGGDVNMERMTTWSIRGAGGGEPHGMLWRTAEVLDDLNQATVDSAGVLAQANAVRFGEDNGADTAFIVPIVPEIPAERGELDDFEYPLRRSLKANLKEKSSAVQGANNVGGSIPDSEWPYRLGPWARLFEQPGWYGRGPWYSHESRRGWRRVWGIRVKSGPARERTVRSRGGRRISGPSAGGGRAGRGASRGHGPREGGTYTWQPTKMIPQGYTTFGPYFWAHHWVRGFAARELDDSRYTDYFSKISNTKLAYLFSGPDPELKTIHRPWWVTDLEEARRLGADATVRKTHTRYYYLEVIYKGEDSDGEITSHNLNDPVTKDFGDWLPPEDLHGRVFRGDPEVSGPEQLGALPMWRFTAEGTEERLSPDGEVIEEWPVYFEWYFIFGGLDCGGDLTITNPANWDDDDELPAPMLLTESAREGYDPKPNVAARREYFSVLGLVRDGTRAPIWSERFTAGNPLESVVTLAQAKVFNNQSWDLWTQDWQVLLTPVVDWYDWVARMDHGLNRIGETNGMVSGEEVRDLRDYLWRLGDPTADVYLAH